MFLSYFTYFEQENADSSRSFKIISIGILPSNGFQVIKALLVENGFDLKEGDQENAVEWKGQCHTKIRRKKRRFDISFRSRFC